MRRGFVHLAGNLSGWPKGTVPTPKVFRDLDQYASELVNGDEGGTWSPTSPIVLGSQVTPAVSLPNANSLLSGDVETVRGNAVGDELDMPGLILQGGSPPVFESARTRSVVIAATLWTDQLQNGFPVFVDSQLFTARSLRGHGRFIVPLPLRAAHRGATIASVDFVYSILEPDATQSFPSVAFPAVQPTFNVLRLTSTTGVSLHNNTGGYGASGQLNDGAADAVAYYNNGQPRTKTYVPNQNNTSLDPTQYVYVADVSFNNVPPESRFHGVRVNLTSIADMRAE